MEAETPQHSPTSCSCSLAALSRPSGAATTTAASAASVPAPGSAPTSEAAPTPGFPFPPPWMGMPLPPPFGKQGLSGLFWWVEGVRPRQPRLSLSLCLSSLPPNACAPCRFCWVDPRGVAGSGRPRAAAPGGSAAEPAQHPHAARCCHAADQPVPHCTRLLGVCLHREPGWAAEAWSCQKAPRSGFCPFSRAILRHLVIQVTSL